MGRIRTIKPEFHTHEALSALPAEAHLLASGLLCYADDEGYFNANPKLVQAAVFPVRNLAQGIEELLKMLEECGYVRMLKNGGKTIGHIVSFASHQRVNRPSPSRLKPHGGLTEDSLPEGKGKEGKGTGKQECVSECAMEPEMVTRAVLTELAISGRELSIVLTDVCKAEMQAGREWEALKDELCRSWREYTEAKPNLEYAWGAEKFFGQGAWKNKPGWPWKDGKAPAPKRIFL